MKIVVFGAGRFGVNYIRELSGNVVGVVETDKVRAEFIKNSYNVPVYSELPRHLDFDGIVVATPPETHIQIAKPFLEQGCYALIEKPLGTSVEECLQLRRYRDKVMSGLVYLYHPEVDIIKKWLQENKPNHVFTRRTNNGPVREWQDALWDLAPHDISILNYISGQTPVDLSCYRERDFAVLNLEYLNFTSVTYVSWVGGPKIRQVELVSNPERYIFDDMKTSLEVTPLRRMLNDFLTGDWDQKCSFDAGLDVLNILEKASKI